jgi:NhaP-type Na+/H+ or K+/H+ antiporter
MHTDPVTQLAGVVILAFAMKWLAARIRVPSILVLLVAGFLLGPILGWLDPDAVLGDLLAPAVSLAVGLILFEGGLSLRLREVEGQQRVIGLLVTVGVLITWTVGTLAALAFTDLNTELAVLLGAILVVSGPTVVGPLLTQVRPARAVSSVLKWESIFIDPVGAMAAVIVFDIVLISAEPVSAGKVALLVGEFLLTGIAIGAVLAFAAVRALRRHWVPEHLVSLFGLSLALAAFIAANALVEEAGLLATTVLGLILSNHRRVRTEQIVRFSEVIRTLLIGVLFIVLSARLTSEELRLLGPGAVALILILVLVARPLATLASTWGSPLQPRERILIAGVAPRGIVAASIASVFALELERNGVAGAEELVPITFAVVVGTVAIYGLGMAPLARRMGLARAHQDGVLIVGAGRVERDIGRALHDAGITVVMATTNRADDYSSRMEGLRTHYGNVITEDIDIELDLAGIGHLLALTPNDEVNTLAATRFREIFGGGRIYQLAPAPPPAGIESHAAEQFGGRSLFASDLHYGKLRRELERGSSIKATRISGAFDAKAYRAEHGEAAVPLFVRRESGRLSVVTEEDTGVVRDAADGDVVISLVPGE